MLHSVPFDFCLPAVACRGDGAVRPLYGLRATCSPLPRAVAFSFFSPAQLQHSLSPVFVLKVVVSLSFLGLPSAETLLPLGPPTCYTLDLTVTVTVAMFERRKRQPDAAKAKFIVEDEKPHDQHKHHHHHPLKWICSPVVEEERIPVDHVLASKVAQEPISLFEDNEFDPSTIDTESSSETIVHPIFQRNKESTPLELFYDLFFVANLTAFTGEHEINDGINMRSVSLDCYSYHEKHTDHRDSTLGSSLFCGSRGSTSRCTTFASDATPSSTVAARPSNSVS